MNEEKYTRNSAKKSTRKKKVNPDIHAGKSHGEKLKNDSSAARSYRDKIRYGKRIIHCLSAKQKNFAA